MSTERLPLNTLAIPFGTAGLAEIWTAAAPALALPEVIPDALWLLTAMVWAATIAAHIVRGIRVRRPLAEQLRHPAQGPVAALVPVVGMLLGARLHLVAPLLGRALVVLAVSASAVFAGWILAQWLRGGVPGGVVHGGYLLPTVASGLIGGVTAASVGLPALGWAAFAVGVLFWIALFAILLARFGALPALPSPLTPTLAILVAPPAVAGLAWMSLTGERSGPVIDALVGLTVLSVLTQVALVPLYRRTPFTLGAWSYTFPFAAVATFLVAAMPALPVITPVIAIALAAAITALVGGVTARSIGYAVATARAEEPALSRRALSRSPR